MQHLPAAELALRVILHALATDAFYARYATPLPGSRPTPPNLAAACPGIADSPARQAMMQVEADWRGRLQEREADLWAWLQHQDTSSLLRFLAVCVARTADADRADWTTPQGPGCIEVQVATAAGLDMPGLDGDEGGQPWPGARGADPGRRAGGASASAAARLAGTKKEVMAADAEALLAGTGWLPAVLHLPG